MRKNNKKNPVVSIVLFAAFAVWTAMVRYVDVQVIGPMETSVGLATVNRFIHDLTGVHLWLYRLTDWLGLVPVAVCIGFGLLGLIQLIRRRGLQQVDFSILVLGGFYLVTAAVYLLFECVVVNYRPILIEGRLEASYPSSTTLLVLCVMPVVAIQLNERIKSLLVKRYVFCIICGFIVFMVVGRLVSGVHWFSDIVGGILLSSGLVSVYRQICGLHI